MKHLVRDNIPREIVRTGKIPVVRRLTAEEYRVALLDKVVEEALELRISAAPEEIADLLEVLDAVRTELGISVADLEEIRIAKRRSNGAFETRSFLEDVVDPMSDCEFCQEFALKECRILTPPLNRILFESENFVIFPTLGSFVEGYLLLCPRFHVPSFAWLDEPYLSEYQSLLEQSKAVLERHYCAPIVFEHGETIRGLRAGGYIDHAHLHIVPGNVEIEAILAAQHAVQELGGWEDLSQWRDRPYLFGQSQSGRCFICEPAEGLKSQFLRRRVAEALGHNDIWDWGAYLGAAEIRRTLAKLAPAFSRMKLHQHSADGKVPTSRSG